MVQRYQSQHTRTFLDRQDGEHISTAELEKKVLEGNPGSYDTQTKKIEDSLKTYEREVQQATLSQYGAVTRTALQTCQSLGLPVVSWVQVRQAQQAQRDATELEQIVGKYQKEATKVHKTIQENRDLRAKAEILMERYDTALAEMQVRHGELQKEYDAAKTEAIGDTRSTSYLGVHTDMEHIRMDMHTVKRNRDMAAAKAIEYQARIAGGERVMTHIQFFQQKFQSALIKASGTVTYTTIIQSEQQLKPVKAFQNLHQKERRAVKLMETSLQANRAFLDMMKSVHDYEGIDFPEAEQDEIEQELRRRVDERNDQWVDKARRVLEQDKTEH